MNEPTTQNDEYVYIFFYAAPKHTDICNEYKTRIFHCSPLFEQEIFLWMVFTDRNFCLFISYVQQHAVLYDTCLKSYLIF